MMFQDTRWILKMKLSSPRGVYPGIVAGVIRGADSPKRLPGIVGILSVDKAKINGMSCVLIVVM